MAMIGTYKALRERQQNEFDKFPCFYAFNERQFREGMAQLNVSDTKELYRGFGGMFYRKSDAEKLHALLRRFETEKEEAYKDDKFLYGAFRYEMEDHEYFITFDDEEILDSLGLTQEEVVSNERMSAIWFKARKDYLRKA